MLGKKAVEAEHQHAKPLLSQPPGLLRSKERLAGSRASCDGRSWMPVEHVEDVVLLLRELEQFPRLLCHLQGEGSRDLERIRKRALDVFQIARGQPWPFLSLRPVIEDL